MKIQANPATEQMTTKESVGKLVVHAETREDAALLAHILEYLNFCLQFDMRLGQIFKEDKEIEPKMDADFT